MRMPAFTTELEPGDNSVSKSCVYPRTRGNLDVPPWERRRGNLAVSLRVVPWTGSITQDHFRYPIVDSHPQQTGI